MRNLQVTFKKTENTGPLALTLEGNLTSASAIDFKRDLITLIGEHKKDCHVNISDLKQMDVTGVNALAMAHKAATKIGKQLVIVSSDQNPAEEFLHLTKFQQYFTFHRA